MTTSQAVAAALAEVCGYHEGDNCQHCAEALLWRYERGWTDADLLADIELYRTDFNAWADKTRGRLAAESTEEA